MKSFLSLLILGSGLSLASPPVIDDMELAKSLRDHLGELADQKATVSGETLATALKSAPKSAAVDPGTPKPTPDYEDLTRSVFLMGSVYKCGKCEHWHPSGTATAWCVGRDGLMITNYHVFENAKGDAWGVCDINGRVCPVKEILAGNKADDVALFRVDAKDLVPLPIVASTPVGTEIRVLSHPSGHCYVETFGRISRYFRKPGKEGDERPVMMAITADYAKGSSGGPVITAEGFVAGMVSNTQTITYGEDKKPEGGPVQMVVKNCVTGTALQTLISPPATPASTR